ncbi:protein FAM149B1 isoform X2 [Lingula anatina]|uniref:Protein FAM149B1 isoform X2 n=1 Tax=Lingula anatina TaxID=7574 RepID=A0A1S3HRW0_LINAN|nr:protein FAM149B1 isoform X2 [Lingula anatina]|eukprot:XP_013388773.1 protein FAM149B1 isoform X2 [Lingula anatina]
MVMSGAFANMHDLSLPVVGVKVWPTLVYPNTTKTKDNKLNRTYSNNDIKEIYTQERRGISRGSVDVHPLPEFGQQTLPPEFLQTTQDAISNYHSSRSSPSQSGRSSPLTESQSWLCGSQAEWTGGNTTDRSSIYSTYSWGDDEFERQASKTVRQLFEEIDSVLFEQSQSGPSHIVNECQEWVETFPHLRILGRQFFPTQDQGFVAIASETPRPATGSVLVDVTEQDLSATTEQMGLSITGRQVTPRSVPSDSLTHRTNPDSAGEYAHLEEEVIEQDGEYEDIIAIDYKHDDDEGHESRVYHSPRRRRPGFPPMTPTACAKDTIAVSSYEYIWSEQVVNNLKKLLRLYHVQLLTEKEEEDDMPMLPDLPSHLGAIMNDKVPPSRENSIINDKQLTKFPHMQLEYEDSFVKGQQGNLDFGLVISSFPLLRRENSGFGSEAMERPGSSFNFNKQNRPISNMFMGNNSFLRNPSSATFRRKPHPQRLAPLDGRAKTPGAEGEEKLAIGGIQGHRLSTFNERLSSPPQGASRASAHPLPPIGFENIDGAASPQNATAAAATNAHTSAANPQQQKNNTTTQKKAHFANRASSAVHDNNLRAGKDRLKSAHHLETRPSTTHTFRADTPHGQTPNPAVAAALANTVPSRRSSTPLGYSGTRGGLHLGSPAGREMLLGITGSGINPSSEAAHAHIDYNEDSLEDQAVHSQSWAPSHTSPGNPYRRKTQLNSVR